MRERKKKKIIIILPILLGILDCFEATNSRILKDLFVDSINSTNSCHLQVVGRNAGRKADRETWKQAGKLAGRVEGRQAGRDGLGQRCREG